MVHETTYYVLRYNLRPEAGAEYKKWLADLSQAGSDRAGWIYVGTFFDLMGFDRFDYETRWQLNGHGSVGTRPLDAETERRLRDRLPFVAEGRVAMLQALSAAASRGH